MKKIILMILLLPSVAMADVVFLLTTESGELMLTDERTDGCSPDYRLAIHVEDSGPFQLGCWRNLEVMGRFGVTYDDGQMMMYRPEDFHLTDYGRTTYGD